MSCFAARIPLVHRTEQRPFPLEAVPRYTVALMQRADPGAHRLDFLEASSRVVDSIAQGRGARGVTRGVQQAPADIHPYIDSGEAARPHRQSVTPLKAIIPLHPNEQRVPVDVALQEHQLLLQLRGHQ